ncbi:hypothetical protein [Thalassorhabdomicrobium marinisediminis]|uniref:Uncharacterized protein n=1 Tax=Thalassorhabdomicrobium marinisediminis TaxID=2170577 RepID=A0A2T7FTF7_9RHOB|nr:hypothetical protein [Thalassorhabdomicrobium marinisediminis]PVA05445.1 hypothetical protein DC363_15665 [Thalassorhabdomicrobium marinisediminis]
MEIIEKACAQLAGHADHFVQELADEISRADSQRHTELVKLKAKLSTASAEIKTLRAELKRKNAQIKDL